ncbi:RDD family protein [Verrucomicrobium sp. BvORR106]|uniref:RDD family protein n=1 Tax=Verrucomicrobium sp. BvORR106 TaxID=1403819 RepID=UPI0005717158|nr:RDD family protein [Verrucomicrobium sp. BvORR106]
MNWFYSENGQQKGPISDMELTTLVRGGTIPVNTLVWREGLPDWQPLSQVRPDLTQVSATTPTLGGVPVYDKGLLLQQMREGVVTEATHPGAIQYVGFWWRFLAFFIDYIVLSVAGCLIIMPFAFGLGLMAGASGGDAAGAAIGVQLVGQLVLNAIQLVIWGGYFTWMNGKYGATLGKLALGFKVINADGTKTSYLRALGRFAAEYILNGIILTVVALVLVGLVMALGFGGFRSLMESNRDAFAGGIAFGMLGSMVVGFLLGSFPWWMAAFDPEKRALHDRISATRVVRK